MTIKLSTEVRNARMNSILTTIGPSGILKVRSGTPPTYTSDADVGIALAVINMPSGWLTESLNGSIAMSGTWSDSSADNTGTATHFRIYDYTDTTCHLQGTVDTSGADMIVLTTAFVASQPYTVTAFTLTDGNG